MAAAEPPSASESGEATSLLLECALELWYTQRLLLGPLHPECAQTLHAIGSAMQALLASAPQRLFQDFPQWATPALASKAEQRALQLHLAIAALYA